RATLSFSFTSGGVNGNGISRCDTSVVPVGAWCSKTGGLPNGSGSCPSAVLMKKEEADAIRKPAAMSDRKRRLRNNTEEAGFTFQSSISLSLTERPRRESHRTEKYQQDESSRRKARVRTFDSWTAATKNGIVLSAIFLGGVSSFGRPH